MVYGYIREGVPSQEQGQDIFPEFLDEKSILLNEGVQEIIEDHFLISGRENPNLRKLIEKKIKRKDTVYIMSLSSLSGSLAGAITIVEQILQKGADVIWYDVGHIKWGDDNLYKLLNIIAYEERKIGCERNLEGKAIAKKKTGFTEGRPKSITQERLDEATKLLENNKIDKVSELTGISKSSIIREQKRRELKEWEESLIKEGMTIEQIKKDYPRIYNPQKYKRSKKSKF